MPIEIRDLDGGLGNIILGRGTVTEAEYVDVLKKHLTQDKAKFKKYRCSLIDLTAVSKVEVSTKAIKLIAEHCMSAAIGNSEIVVAEVADKDLIFGLARMWEILTDATDWEIMVFRNREDADDWIRQKVKE